MESNPRQTYTLGVLASSTSMDAARIYEDFIPSAQDQQFLADSGFRSL
jgi:ABC-type molybdate transport system substrate-binding protein